jgi:hypothetical protein
MDIGYRDGSLVFHELSFSVHSLGSTVSHDTIVIIKDGVDWKWPGMDACNAKDILEGNGFFIGLIHGVGSLFLQSINGTNTGHESVTNIHEHTGGEQKGSDTEQGHDTNKVDDNGMEGTFFIRTEKVIPAKEGERVGCTSPRIQQEEEEVFCGVVVVVVGCEWTYKQGLDRSRVGRYYVTYSDFQLRHNYSSRGNGGPCG